MQEPCHDTLQGQGGLYHGWLRAAVPFGVRADVWWYPMCVQPDPPVGAMLGVTQHGCSQPWASGSSTACSGWSVCSGEPRFSEALIGNYLLRQIDGFIFLTFESFSYVGYV